ncbi:hypothetical protein EI427_24785 [Flammeovirga pectinis]|uniref:Uncharacterized protein n=2 Tax=Flammeovirga pectinis TaxID=2494373 RepID=A0A3Q9FQ85_9BACT|nr:hypothetical protein EI427_24785 [Flammeovirga pectinis]
MPTERYVTVVKWMWSSDGQNAFPTIFLKFLDVILIDYSLIICMTMTFLEDFYQEKKVYFSSLTTDELISKFNREVGNTGWTGSRGVYLAALNEEISKRKIKGTDLIIQGGRMSILRKVKFVNNQLFTL